jgi:hypothetical protein
MINIKNYLRAWGCRSVVEHLPSMCKAFPAPHTHTHKKKNKKKNKTQNKLRFLKSFYDKIIL